LFTTLYVDSILHENIAYLTKRDAAH